MAALVSGAWAQGHPQTGGAVTAVVDEAPPFAMKGEDGQLSGFSIDLWNAVADKLNLKTSFLLAPDVHRLYDVLREKKADVIIEPTVPTKELDDQFDFSYPVLNAGYLVVIRDTGQSQTDNPLIDLLHIVISPVLLLWLGFVLIFVLLPAHLFWFFDRGTEDSISPGKAYFPGILHAIVWSMTALVSQVQQLPRHTIARALGLVWMFVGVVFIAFYTAQMTAALTVQQIHGAINGPEDLPGKLVGAWSGSHSADVALELRARVKRFKTIEEVFAAVEAKKVDAAVVTASLARYHTNHEGVGRLVTVGEEFHRHDFGFILPLDSDLRRKIDDVMIGLKEDGTYEEIYNKWFGGS
jgi:polar amino acid transport system substrate-binding protein